MFKKRYRVDSGTSRTNRGSTEPKKQRVVDCVKILLDVAKESSDWFPPLKSALGGVYALINHYEQFEDVREKVEELMPQLDRFKKNITTTTIDGDPEETDRRRELASTFNEIEELSQKMLEKSAISRFVDKGEDAKAVMKLIERLREAIVCYQTSQQQAIYDQITHLTSSFDALLKLQEKPPVVRDKLESVLARLNRLEDAPEEEQQHERWASDLRPIKDKAKRLYERITTEGYAEDKKDIVAASALAEDIRDVLLEYWTLRQQELYDQGCRLIDAADLSVLNNFRRAQGAEYRHGDRRGCLKGTRGTVLNEIESWANDFTKSPVFWLNGLAGTGKTTIAQTIAELFFAGERLGASFFCSRDFEDRSNLHSIFPTLAFQLAYKYPDFRSHLVRLLRSNPDVAHESLYNQMQKLIAEPLRKTGISTVVVIDALDECKDDEPSSAILSVLARFVAQIPGVKFFITGRPEPRIRTGFRLPLLIDSTDVFVLHDVHPTLIDNDIRLYLKHELDKIARRHQLEGWPSSEHIDLLCRRAAGLFVYAVATVKFLDKGIYLPERRLDIIVNLPQSTVPEGKTQFKPRITLDSLYASILQTAFSEQDLKVDSKVRSTIGAVVLLVNPLPPSGIAELVGLDPREVMLVLTSVQSLLTLGEDLGAQQPVKPFHKSFPDFITDPTRCDDPRFYISPVYLHLGLATSCLRVMNDGLEQDLLSLPAYALNSEVEDLQARIDDRVSTALQYACRSWSNHLTGATGNFSDVISHLHTFLEEKFLAWLEVLSVLGDVGGAAVALEKLMSWSREVVKDDWLLDTSRDCFYFVTKFFEPINASATHIYHSALELSPTPSVVRKLYYVRCNRIALCPRVVVGAPGSWNHRVSLSSKDCENYESCTWSPCGRFIAAQTKNAVEIRNQLTLELFTTLQPTEPVYRLTGPLAYPPDGRSIACASQASILIWDIQTGGVSKEIACAPNITSMVWSSDGRTIATTGGMILIADSYVTVRSRIRCVRTYDVASGIGPSAVEFKSCVTPYLWAHKTSFRIASISLDSDSDSDCATIKIFEIGSTLIQVHSFDITHLGTVFLEVIWSISPTASRFSISAPYGLYILDYQNSNVLLKETRRFTSHCFSSDGSFFAAVSERVVHIWRYNPGRYILWKTFSCRSSVVSPPCFSPTGSLILEHAANTLQVWRFHDLPTIPSYSPHLPTFSSCPPYNYACVGPYGNYIATANNPGSAVTIIGIHSHVSRFIDAGAQIMGLFLTGNVLLVDLPGEIVAWRLTEEGRVDSVFSNRRAGRSDSIWKISKYVLPNLIVDSGSRVGAIGGCFGDSLHAYHTETGEVLQSVSPLHPIHSRSLDLLGMFRGRDYDILDWRTRIGDCGALLTTLQDGWVKDPEGSCRLWVPVEWRDSWDSADWVRSAATQISIVEDEPVIVKF